MVASDIAAFLEAMAADGHGFSEAKVEVLDTPDHVIRIHEDGAVVAVGAHVQQLHGDGERHTAIETLVLPSMQFPAFERAVLDATIAATPTAYPISVWSQRVSLDRALEEAGFAATRSLAFMAVDLPLPNPGVEHRPLTDGEWPAIVRINNDAFAAHREAASLTVDDARRIMGEPGFSEEGVRIAEIDEVPVAFCWTKVHPNGDGEVYRIATSPAHQGRGLGRQAVLAGFEWLARQPSVERGTLWVDEANDAALSLYRDLGMEILRRNREFTRS